jgi:peptidoglycan/LPS O-acetylase OafA/YrhL
MPTDRQLPAIRALTGIRWFAAFWVVLYHFEGKIKPVLPAWRYLDPISRTGFVGVDLFFVLSGFIMSYNYLDRFRRWHLSQHLHFLALRLARIYPVYFVTLMIVLGELGLSKVFHKSINTGSIFTVKQFFANLFMVNGWGFQKVVFAWNFPAWSVSAEWFAYLLFPFFALLVVRITSRLISGGLAIALLSTYIVLYNHSWGGPLTRVVCEFLCGMFLFRIYDSDTSARPWQWIAPVGLVAGPIIVWTTSGTPPADLLVFDCAVVVIGLAIAQGRIARFFGSAQMVFLGEISYSLYLTHGLILRIQNKVLPMTHYVHSGVVTRVGIVIFYGVVVFVSAAGMYLIVEKPSRNWLRTRIKAPKVREGV